MKVHLTVLHDGMSRDRFISEATEIAKRLGYNDIKQLRSNGQLQDKIAKLEYL